MVHNNPSKKRAGPLISGEIFWYFFLEGGVKLGQVAFLSQKKQGNHLQRTNRFERLGRSPPKPVHQVDVAPPKGNRSGHPGGTLGRSQEWKDVKTIYFHDS